MDTLRACRPMLPEALFRLTRHVATKCPDKLDAWRDELLALRDSELWTSHWGISEITVDYTFELRIWERLLAIPGMPSRLRPIFQACAKTYEEAEALKAGSRADHFLQLAAMCAKCSWRDDAEKWREKGTACSLTYGYHKDTTLDHLVDALELLNQHESERGIQRSAAILEMVKWMPAVTDNRMTKEFEQSVFRVVVLTSREAAFALIRFFCEHTGRWKVLDCVEQYCESANTGDPEVLWTLKDAFTPHFVERGRHPKQVARVTQRLRDLAVRLDAANAAAWQERYITFIRTHVDPGWWPDDVWGEVQAKEARTPRHARDQYSSSPLQERNEFTVGGQPMSRVEIERRLAESIDSFSRTVEQLRSENDHFYDRNLINPHFRRHVAKTASLDELSRLWKLARDDRDLVDSESLHVAAHRLFDFGDSDAGFECLLLAYQRSSDYWSGSHHARPYLVELCDRDRERVANFLVERCRAAFQPNSGGFDLPRMIARFFAACGDVVSLRRVFEDYLNHCEELFAHLPREERYAWLRDYREDGRDESEQTVEFLLDLLREPEIDQSQRLLRVLANLAKTRAELVCRAVCRRMLKAESLLRERLEALLDLLAWLCPQVLARHLEALLPLLQEPHFRLRMTLIGVIRTVSASTTVPRSTFRLPLPREGRERVAAH